MEGIFCWFSLEPQPRVFEDYSEFCLSRVGELYGFGIEPVFTLYKGSTIPTLLFIHTLNLETMYIKICQQHKYF